MGKDAGMIFRSLVEAARKLDAETRAQVYDAYFDLVLDDIEYSGENPIVDALLTAIRPSVEKVNRRYKASVENGKKGGAPAENKNAKKSEPKQPNDNSKQPKNNLKQPKTTQNNPTEKQNNLKEEVEVEEEVFTNVNKKNIRAVNRPTRHRFGEFQHVLLTDDEYQKLIKDYGEFQTKQAIKKVDEYCEQSGKSYKNYNLTLRKWGFEGLKEQDPDAEARDKLYRKLMEG